MIKGSGHPPVNLICEFCKNTFMRSYKFRDQKYCSLKCASLFGWSKNRKSFEKPCEICGKPMQTRPDRIKNGRGKYCSKICYWKGMSITQTGKIMSEETRIKLSMKRVGTLNPAFIHGYSESMSEYKSQFNKLLKEKVLERDNYQCKNGHKYKIVHVHHIDFDKSHNIIENLVTLCPKCHKNIHKIIG